MTRLGAGVDPDGRLREDAMQRVYAALTSYEPEIERHGAGTRIAVLTSAVRDSANGEEFAATVRERFGFSPHVLSGDEEARLTFLGATSERDPEDATPTLVFDIGGGSTEMVIGAGREVDFHVSTQAGVVRQTERHLHSDPPPDAEQRELAADVEAIIAAAVPDAAAGRVSARSRWPAPRPHWRRSPSGSIPTTRAGCTATGCRATRASGSSAAGGDGAGRAARGGGPAPDRAPTIVAGGLIFLAVLGASAVEEVEISEHDILRGAALALPDRRRTRRHGRLEGTQGYRDWTNVRLSVPSHGSMIIPG